MFALVHKFVNNNWNKTGTSVKDRDFTTWIEQLKEAEQSREKSNRQSAERASIGHGDLDQQKLLNPLALCYEVDRQLGPEPKGNTHDCESTPSLMVGDGGDFVACAAYTMRPRGGLSWLDPGAFGTLGVGGGFALGTCGVREYSLTHSRTVTIHLIFRCGFVQTEK